MSHVQHDVYTTFENECVFVSVRVWNKGLNGLRFVCFFYDGQIISLRSQIV